MRSGDSARLPRSAEVPTHPTADGSLPAVQPFAPSRASSRTGYARQVFRRRQPDADPTLAESLAEVETRAAEAAKGRPTPKRRDAQAERAQRMKPPKDRREAYKMQRDRQKEDRSKVRNALITGDDRYLPSRDRGPLRRFVRDWVDARRTIGEFFIIIGLVVVLANLSPSATVKSYATTAWLALLVLLIGEASCSAVGSRRDRRPVPGGEGPVRGPPRRGVLRHHALVPAAAAATAQADRQARHEGLTPPSHDDSLLGASGPGPRLGAGSRWGRAAGDNGDQSARVRTRVRAPSEHNRAPAGSLFAEVAQDAGNRWFRSTSRPAWMRSAPFSVRSVVTSVPPVSRPPRPPQGSKANRLASSRTLRKAK
jgi:hypothetical protein